MALTPAQRNWKLAKADLATGLRAWEAWYLLGISDIRLRYKRSKFGQLWITLSMAIFISGIGFVYSTLFNQPIRTYLPYIAVNYVVWSYLSGVIMDASSAFTQASVYMTQEALPKSIFAMRVVVRNLVLLAHNIVIIPVVYIYFIFISDYLWPPSPEMLQTMAPASAWAVLLAIPGFVLVIIASFLVVMLLGIICTRFRDMIQIMQNVVQLAFFVTPVMWHAEQLKGHWYIAVFNPFAAFLRIVAEPLQGRVPINSVYWACGASIICLAAITLPLFARCRARIVYWL